MSIDIIVSSTFLQLSAMVSLRVLDISGNPIKTISGEDARQSSLLSYLATCAPRLRSLKYPASLDSKPPYPPGNYLKELRYINETRVDHDSDNECPRESIDPDRGQLISMRLRAAQARIGEGSSAKSYAVRYKRPSSHLLC
jgi:hypothetical protein